MVKANLPGLRRSHSRMSADMILHEVLVALQAADELGGPNVLDYIRLMNQLIVQITEQRENAKDLINMMIVDNPFRNIEDY